MGCSNQYQAGLRGMHDVIISLIVLLGFILKLLMLAKRDKSFRCEFGGYF